MNSFTGIFHGLLPANRYFKEHLRLAASVQSFFFYFRKTWSLFSHAGCLLTQEEMPRKDRIQKEKEKAKNVAAKGSRTITSLFPRASTALTLSSSDQLIEDKTK